jgi:hypothetical protein
MGIAMVLPIWSLASSFLAHHMWAYLFTCGRTMYYNGQGASPMLEQKKGPPMRYSEHAFIMCPSGIAEATHRHKGIQSTLCGRVHPALLLTTLPLPLPSRIMSFQRPNFHIPVCCESNLWLGLYVFTARGHENFDMPIGIIMVVANCKICLDQMCRTMIILVSRNQHDC